MRVIGLSFHYSGRQPVMFGSGANATPKELRFYRPGDQYGYYSNFSPHGFMLDGKYWPSSEHYYQAHKFVGIDDAYAEAIRQAPTAKDAYYMTRDPKMKPRINPNWDTLKVDVMRRAVFQKFATHADIRQHLLNTGNDVLIENSPKDYFWGCGKDNSGKNMLGKLLMDLREHFRKHPPTP